MANLGYLIFYKLLESLIACGLWLYYNYVPNIGNKVLFKEIIGTT